MNLKDIAAISGKSGLFRILKPTRNGVVLESLDEKKTKLIASLNYKVSILSEISIYTTDREGTVRLENVMAKIYEKYGTTVSLATNDNKALIQFLDSVLPEFDKQRVYASDIKKLVNWYNILGTFAEDVFTAQASEESNEEQA